MKKNFSSPESPWINPLLLWFQHQKRDLPWRNSCNPYAIWVSEIILQQTRVDQGLPYYNRFMQAFPTVLDLANASEDQVLKLWEGLGYYSRARNFHKAARIIRDDCQGKLPVKAADWITLPGIGRYTAGAIASMAFGEQVAVLDGNVKRVLARIFAIQDSIDDTAITDRLWDLAESLVPPDSPGDYNQAMMELGATACTPVHPTCDACPVVPHCQAHQQGIQETLPVRRPKKTTPHYEIVVAVIQKKKAYLIGKRPPEGLLASLWEFPGGKVEPGESHEDALHREVLEELGISIRIGGLLAVVNHAYSHFSVTLNVYNCAHLKGVPHPYSHTEIRWIKRDEFDQFAFPTANRKFIPLIP